MRRVYSRDPLTAAQRREHLDRLDGWTETPNRNAIQKRFKFASFEDAFRLMTHVATEATRLDHHPEWTNVYDRVDVILQTHDRDAVTEYDIALASFMDRIFKSINNQ